MVSVLNVMTRYYKQIALTGKRKFARQSVWPGGGTMRAGLSGVLLWPATGTRRACVTLAGHSSSPYGHGSSKWQTLLSWSILPTSIALAGGERFNALNLSAAGRPGLSRTRDSS